MDQGRKNVKEIIPKADSITDRRDATILGVGMLRSRNGRNLRKMLGKYGAIYIMIAKRIQDLLKTLNDPLMQDQKSGQEAVSLALLGKKPTLNEKLKEPLVQSVNEIVATLTTRMPLPSVVAQGKRVNGMIGRNEAVEDIIRAIQDLENRLFDELCEREFLYVASEKAKFYKEPMLFGKDVNDRFPQAIDDIEEAGKCLALNQGTACVLHTMRVLEVGLKALANALKIPYAPSWESYLNHISAQINTKHKNKTARWKKDEAFYRDVSGDLILIKQAFRNPTMHADRKYSADEAEQIFIAAKTFMCRIATHFNEKEIEKLLR